MPLTKITLDALGSSITINADALTSGTVPLNRLSAANSSANGIVTTSGQTFAGDKTFQNTVTVTGNLTVLGTSVTLNSETVLIKDNIITLNSNVTGAPVLDAGIEVNRGTSANVTFKWNETSDIWQLTNDGTNYGDVLTTLSSTGINASALSTGTVPLGRLSSANSSANGVVDTTTQTFAGNKTFQNTASFSNTVSITGAANALSTFGVGGTLSALGQLSVTGNATFDTSTLFVDATNDRVGIGTASPAYPLEISKSQGTQLRLIGGSTGYTQGSLLIQSSTTDTPQSRGLGMYLFNEGTDVNWYAGTLYNDGDAFGITRKANASFDIAAADVASMLFRIANTGSVSIALSGALISNVASNNVYTITSGAWGSGATGPRGIFASSAVLGTSGGGYGTVGYNVRYTSTTNSYLYAVTDVASLLVFDDGFTFKRAASGTGGNAITFSDFVRIDSSGRVGIGVTSPTSILHLSGPTPVLRLNSNNAANVQFKLSNNNLDDHGLHLLYNPQTAVGYIENMYLATSGQVYGDIEIRQNVGGTQTTRMIVKADGGNVGIGTTNPAYTLDVKGTAIDIRHASSSNVMGYLGQRGGGVDGGYFSLNLAGTTKVAFDSNGTSFINGGDVGIGKTSPSAKLDVLGNIRHSNTSGGYLALTHDLTGYTSGLYATLKTDDTCLYFDVAGVYTGYICNNGGFTDVSDGRLKTNVSTIMNAISAVLQLRGVNYAWKDGRDNFQNHTGFIAQEVQAVIPDVVADGCAGEDCNGPGILGVQDSALLPWIVEAFKEMYTEIQTLRARVAALEG